MSNFDKKLDKATKHYKNKNYKEALKICDKILAKDYNNEKALELEGEILYKLDRLDEAVLNWKINAEYNNNPTAKMHLEDIDKSTKDKALSFDNLNAVSSTPEDEIEEVVNPVVDVTPKTVSEEKINSENDETSTSNNVSNINSDLKEDKSAKDSKNIKEDIAITSKDNDDNTTSSNSEALENSAENSNKSEEAETKKPQKKGKKSAIIAVCAIIVVVAAYAGVSHFKSSNANKAETEQSQVNKEQEQEKEIPKDFKENLDKATKDKDVNKVYALLDEAPSDKIPAEDKDSYNKAVDFMKKDGVEKYYNNGLNDYKDKKFDNALDNLSKAYKYSNDTYLKPHILYFMGATENALGKKDDSVKYFKEYLEDYPHSDLYTAEILYNLCLYYNDKGDKADAKKYAQHLEDSYPSSPYYNDIAKEILYN